MTTPLTMLLQGQIALVALILIALIVSLSFHEYGHALVARHYGDDTAERAGRLTINPIAHIDPIGLLMVLMVGFGLVGTGRAYPKPTISTIDGKRHPSQASMSPLYRNWSVLRT